MIYNSIHTLINKERRCPAMGKVDPKGMGHSIELQEDSFTSAIRGGRLQLSGGKRVVAIPEASWHWSLLSAVSRSRPGPIGRSICPRYART